MVTSLRLVFIRKNRSVMRTCALHGKLILSSALFVLGGKGEAGSLLFQRS